MKFRTLARFDPFRVEDAITSFTAAPQGICGGAVIGTLIYFFRLSAVTIVTASVIAVLWTLAACCRYARSASPSRAAE